MNPIEFQSSSGSIIVSWIVFCVWLAASVRFLNFLFKKNDQIPYSATVWTGLCILVLSPIRYTFFQNLLFNVYCYQSVSNVPSILLVGPIVFCVILGVMGMLGITLPYLINNALFLEQKKVTFGRGVLATLLIPLSCVLSTMLFYCLTPYAAWTLKWLNYRDLIRATNGAPAFVFKYVHRPFGYTEVPSYFEETKKTDTDWLRCHVAGMYMSDENHVQFIKTQYSDLNLKKKLNTAPSR